VAGSGGSTDRVFGPGAGRGNAIGGSPGSLGSGWLGSG
jgi:hypothetical protein